MKVAREGGRERGIGEGVVVVVGVGRVGGENVCHEGG